MSINRSGGGGAGEEEMQPLLGDGWGRGSPVSHASSASTDSSCVDGASHTKGDAKDDAAGSGAGAAHSRPPWPWPISAVLPNEGGAGMDKGGSKHVVESVSAALLGCIMAAVGGLSIASSVFPVGTDVHFPEFYSAGLYWGLFCGAIANWTLLGLSRMPCAVGGTLLPAIIVIKRYAEAQIGPEEPTTVMMAYTVSTFVFGAVACLLGRSDVLRSLFRLVPFPVLLGFLASIGVSMFADALNPVVPDPRTNTSSGGFTKLSDRQSWVNLGREGAVEKWAPGVGAAICVFVLQREWAWRPRWLVSSARFLAPIVAVLMIVVVNLTPGARENGWLAPTQRGTSPAVMFKLWPWAHLGSPHSGGNGVGVSQSPLNGVWDHGGGDILDPPANTEPVPTVKWELLWGNGLFLVAVIEAIIIGMLALLEDLAMVHKATAVANPTGASGVNLSWEVQAQGVMNIVSSMLCGLPASLVGSYSFAALKLGGGGPVFFVTQALGSAFFLSFAGYIIEGLPTMVPCFILFWVAMQMAGWGLWDMRPVGVLDFGAERTSALDPFEYGLVWAMVIVSLDPLGWVMPNHGFDSIDKSGTLIFVTMMVLGLFFSFFHTIRLARRMPPLHLKEDLATLPSDAARSLAQREMLASEGRRVLVLQLSRQVVTFHNVGTLEREIETLMETRGAELALEKDGVGKGWGARRLLAVVIDLSLIEGFTVDAGQMFLELLPIATKHGVRMVLSGASTAVTARLCRFGAPLEPMQPPLDFSGLWEDEAGDAIWSTSKPLHAVLEGVEETLLQQGGDGVPQC